MFNVLFCFVLLIYSKAQEGTIMSSATTFDHEKMYTYIKEYATCTQMEQTLRALSFAHAKNEEQDGAL